MAMMLPATRRRFLSCASALLAGTVVATIPARWSFADTDAQWARLQRGLSQKSMAGCRKAADRLAPRLGALLKGPQWESQTFKAIADELKQAGVYPDHPPPLSPGCADALRGEASSTSSTTGSVDASLAAAATVVATLPGVGAVIAAVLAAIAAVLILIGQIIAKAKEDQAAAKEKEEQDAKVKKLQRRVTDEMERKDDCILFGKKPD
jgi:Na+-transporting methylmalonyl-CoA/oxaloacetate decarboxylase gamma subunit